MACYDDDLIGTIIGSLILLASAAVVTSRGRMPLCSAIWFKAHIAQAVN